MTKNIYFKILRIYINEFDECMSLQIKNIYETQITIIINDLEYTLQKDEIKSIDFSKNLKVKIDHDNVDLSCNIENKTVSGFNENTMIETRNGPIAIKNIKSGDLILDSNGDDLKVSNVYIFKINKKCNNKPIIVKKSKCGIQLPYSDIVMTIKNNLIIKKIILKGRSLYLNGKADIFTFDETIQIYGIETENQKDFLLSGFIVESI